MSDNFYVQVSGDYYQDYSRFNVYLDGVQYGPTLAVTAAHSNGETQYFGFDGDFSNAHQVSFSFINDNGGLMGSDRNLYFTSFTFDGNSQAGTAAAYNTGTTTNYAAELYHTGDTVGFDVNGYTGSNYASSQTSFAFALTEASFDFSHGHALMTAPNGTVFDLTSAGTISFTDGTVQKMDGAPLVDDLYYDATNLDVWRSHVDPDQHYDQSGWHEGRNPNADFSTTGYLAANADVRVAGINPLTHYDQSGWKEGRDPSAAFDNELYLARNPDVAQAGIDPLAHYLSSGQAEGRQAYAAIGKAADLNVHPGFDAEYYLLSNTDVAKAAIAAGGDSFAFAYNHYEANGWHEGRNPNAVFDVKGYLAAYTDIAAANIDPLAHYDSFGFKEGRDPSASFDTKAYESHYTDVANAGIDPMLHYLQNGALEGRSTFADGHFG